MDRDRTYPLWRFGCPEKICTTKQLQALKFDGWIITDDPLHLSYGGRNLFVDLGAEEPTIAAEKQGRKIAVEIKSFLGASDVYELSASLGQYSMYRHILYEIDPSRELYLAIPAHGKHYELMHVGWHGSRRIHGSVLHLDLIDGKIWIQHDGTSPGVALDLVEAGVPRQDIVLGFRPVDVRPYTDFGTGD